MLKKKPHVSTFGGLRQVSVPQNAKTILDQMRWARTKHMYRN